jgi:hypothetical protein
MASLGNSSYGFRTTDGTDFSGTLTLGAGRRKVDLKIFVESATNTPSTVTINGETPTAYGTNPTANPNDSAMRMWSYYYDVPSGVGAGSIAIGVTLTTAGTELAWHATEVLDAADGAPESLIYAHSSGGASTASVTSSASAALCAAALLHAGTQTIAWTGDVTEISENDSSPNLQSGMAGASAVSSGTRTATATPSSGARTSVLLASYANYSGGSPSNAPRSMFYHNFGMR